MAKKQLNTRISTTTRQKLDYLTSRHGTQAEAIAVAIHDLYTNEIQMTPIKYNLDFDVSIDPYRADTQGRTAQRAYIRPTDNAIHVIIEQTYPGQTGTNPDDFQDVLINFGDSDLQFQGNNGQSWTPDPTAFETYIKSPPARALIERIAAGYSTDWSGRNPGDGYLTAQLDADAWTALDELNAVINDLPADQREFWTMREWCSQIDAGQMDASEIDDMIADPSGGDKDSVIIDDAEEYLMELAFLTIQDQLVLESAENDQLNHRGFTVTVERDEDGDIVKVLRIQTPNGYIYGLSILEGV